MADPNQYPLLAKPHIRLSGPVDQQLYAAWQDGLTNAPAEGPIVVSLSTLGGDPEVARAMGDDVRLLKAYEDRELIFLGKAVVYSAGVTFMSAFERQNRFLTRGTRLLVHERQITKTVNLSGPLKSCVAQLEAVLNEIRHSVNMEDEGFRALIEQSEVDFDELQGKAPSNWYIDAEDAKAKGLVLDVI